MHQDCVYYVNRGGIVLCNNLQTGKLNWSLRLPKDCWASPLAVGDLIYFFGSKGTTTILKADAQEPIHVAENKLDTKETLYGIAAVDRHLLLRFGTCLLCIRKDVSS